MSKFLSLIVIIVPMLCSSSCFADKLDDMRQEAQEFLQTVVCRPLVDIGWSEVQTSQSLLASANSLKSRLKSNQEEVLTQMLRDYIEAAVFGNPSARAVLRSIATKSAAFMKFPFFTGEQGEGDKVVLEWLSKTEDRARKWTEFLKLAKPVTTSKDKDV